MLTSINPTKTKAWGKLVSHFNDIKNVEMKSMFDADSCRVDKFHVQWEDFLLDYSKNRINNTTKELLLELANEVDLKNAIDYHFSGEKINATENRSVLHMALRAKRDDVFLVDGVNVVPEVFKVKEKMKSFTEKILNGTICGGTGKKFTDIVNIGIGGSDLGPAMIVEGLRYYRNNLKSHFISNADADFINDVLKDLNPETTLVIVVSKTFTTNETIANAKILKNWILNSPVKNLVNNHFVAVTSNVEEAKLFGVNENFIFPIWDWVGGRFSVWSAVGLSVSLCLGYDNFEKLLNGAHKVDLHFKGTPFNQNIPVLLALIGVWNNNFLNADTEAVIPYSQFLQKLAPYLQQGVMESNGKNVDRNGKDIDYQTSTIVWGEPGTNAQHAFFQLLHQGTKIIPVDFIGFKESLSGKRDAHIEYMANFIAQSEALLIGKSREDVISELKLEGLTNQQIEKLTSFKVFKGNKPSNTILINKLTPESLGSLIALYEHKIFVQGIIWNIFSYDQWGVELGKVLASNIKEELSKFVVKKHDSSTSFLINQFKVEL